MPDLLFELFSEEIPARMQERAAQDLRARMTDGLVEAGLTYASAAAFSTPRRLTLAVEGLSAGSNPVREERKGPRADAPEKAIAGFLRATGVAREALEERADKKGTLLFAVIERPGRPAAEIVAEVATAVIEGFPWSKSMRWGAGDLRWVRPLRSILCILSDEAGASTVPFTVGGIAAGNTTEGHRFMAPGRVTVTGFDRYEAELARRNVLLRREDRAEKIWHDATTQAFALGLEVVEDPGLLAEVTGLVEWPVVLIGKIGEAYLDLPAEVLQTSMREHQKFFSVRDPRSGQIVRFVTVANRETADQGATILAGNDRVLSARLADAQFFWENDKRTVSAVGLEGMAAPLANVTFHAKLGSEAARVARMAALAATLAPAVGAEPALAEAAARVAKADLASEMVFEFPELQGVMGGYYATHAGLDPAIAAAAAGHYKPLGPSDDLPDAPVTLAVALADKLDTLTGFWAIDEKPTGSGDPFALRRAALGVIRLVLGRSIRLRLAAVIGAHAPRVAADAVGALADPADLMRFFADRLVVFLRGEGIRHDVIEACFRLPGQDDLVDLVARVRALQSFLETEAGADLLAGFKRANNILSAEEKKDGIEYSLDPDPKFAREPAEHALFDALDRVSAEIAPALADEAYGRAMAAMATLRDPIDAFFDQVTVNAEAAVVRRNRLCLLHRIRTVLGQTADFKAIEG